MNISALIIKYKLFVLCGSLMLFLSGITYFVIQTKYIAEVESHQTMEDQMYDQIYRDLHKPPTKHTPLPFPGTFKK